VRAAPPPVEVAGQLRNHVAAARVAGLGPGGGGHDGGEVRADHGGERREACSPARAAAARPPHEGNGGQEVGMRVEDSRLRFAIVGLCGLL
jgi:hypothetical protein